MGGYCDSLGECDGNDQVFGRGGGRSSWILDWCFRYGLLNFPNFEVERKRCKSWII